MKRRLVTAAVLIPLFVGAVFLLPSRTFSVLLGAFVLIACWEWGRLVEMTAGVRVGYCLLAAMLLVVLLSLPEPMGLAYAISLLAVLWWTFAAGWVVLVERTGRRLPAPGSVWLGAAIGFLVLIPPWLALFVLHHSHAFGPGYVLLLMSLIWAADSGAYFAGRRWGGTKLAPHVSPGKTWAGVAGGLAAAVMTGLVGGAVLGVRSSGLILFALLCLITVIFSIVGDLLESLYKRRAGVKDSGQLFPGHGGVLDRIDSVTAAAPVFFAGLSLLELHG